MRRTRMRCPRQQVTKPTSASSLNVPDTTACGDMASAWHASHGAANDVACERSQMVCLVVLAPYVAARSANFANRLRNESLTIPVGPLRCFASWTSASPC
jgi:hypothetical protein